MFKTPCRSMGTCVRGSWCILSELGCDSVSALLLGCHNAAEMLLGEVNHRGSRQHFLLEAGEGGSLVGHQHATREENHSLRGGPGPCFSG